MAIIDVLTLYGAKKRAAHTAKTMKHGVSKMYYIYRYSHIILNLKILILNLYI